MSRRFALSSCLFGLLVSPTLASAVDFTQPGDSPDHSCQVVLRDMGVASDDNGLVTSESGRWVFEGHVDVANAALADGAEPFLLARSLLIFTPDWQQHAPIASTPVDGDKTRFHFRLDGANLPGPEYARIELLVIPFLQQADDTRLFDHNRLNDSTASYRLRESNGFSVDELESCSVHSATLTFAGDWSEHASGPILAGEDLVIDYDAGRLRLCRAYANNQAAWGIDAYAIFNNGEQGFAPLIQEGQRVLGRIQVPADATEVELYFLNSDVFTGCAHWDSNYGDNYVFPIEQPAG